MNDKDTRNKRLEELLRKARLPEPSPQLQERITDAAKRAWNQSPLELPWLIPVRRLVVSAAAAVVLIGLANIISDRALSRWGASAYAADQQLGGVEPLPEIPYNPFVRRLVSLGIRSSVIDASSLSSHVESLKRVLDEAPQSGAANPPNPDNGRSGLILSPPSANSYS